MPLVICPECDSEVELELRYCPNCTAPLPPNARPVPDRTVPVNTTIPTGGPPNPALAAAARKTKTMATLIACVSVIVIIIVIALIFWVTRVKNSANPIDSPSIVLTPTVPGGHSTMPPDDTKYLSFLQNVEASRTDLRNGLNAATAVLVPTPPLAGSTTTGTPTATAPVQQPAAGTPPDSSTTGSPPASPAASAGGSSTPAPNGADQTPQPASSGAADSGATDAGASTSTTGAPPLAPQPPNPQFQAYMQKWTDLVKQFNEEAPPTDCQALATDYDRLVNDYSTMLTALSSAPNPTTDSINQIEQNEQTTIHEDATVTDDALKHLCAAYGVEEPFSIATDLVPPPPAADQGQ